MSPTESTNRLVQRAIVIDDHFLLCMHVQGILERNGIAAKILGDGEKLAELITRFDPQLIIMDIRLAGSDAFEIMEKILAGRYRGVVSLISGSPLNFLLDATAVGSRMGLWMGPALNKPIEDQDIVDAIRAADLMIASRSIAREHRQEGAVALDASRLTLREALDRGALEVWYQPTYDLSTEQPAGAEALVRGRTASGSIVGPGELFAGAAAKDMIDLTTLVLTRAIEDCRRLAEAGIYLKLSVNVPASFLATADPAAFVREVAQERWWPGIILEVTEDEALADIQHVAKVSLQLKLYAVDLSIDDFGAGYSSLARLRDLPFSEIKLDRSFVDGCASDSTKLAICKSVLTLGAELGCRTVAEGIEAEEDLVAIRDIGCDKVQGFRFAKPMPFAALKDLLRQSTIVCA